MTELIFVEGVSGVGKSTMVIALAEKLMLQGYNVKTYTEFDYTNPVDFYCTAYLTANEYELLCKNYISYLDIINRNTINAGDIKLVRYYDKDTPLFKEPLLSELSEKEFCYKPNHLVSLDEYMSVYKSIWNIFALNIDEAYDFIIFDGSLIHHPVNDMMRNYHIIGEQAAHHINTILHSLGERKKYIFYLKTKDIGEQLKRARINRNQSIPKKEQIEFWKVRYKNDIIVLDSIDETYYIYDISNDGWDLAREQMQRILISI